MPSIVVIENVPTVIHDQSGVVALTEKNLVNCGYTITKGVVNLANFGVPQSRRRHLLIASRNGDFLRSFFLRESQRHLTIGQVLDGLEDEPEKKKGIFYQPGRPNKENAARIKYLHDNDIFDLPNFKRPNCHKAGNHAYVSMYGRMKWDQPAQTLTSGFGCMGQGRYVHPTRPRTITPHEAARIQGFPDFFSFHSIESVTALREMIANAVPPQLIASVVLESIETGLLR